MEEYLTISLSRMPAAIGVISPTLGLFLPNIAFLRLLRFLKPLGRVRALFASKIVVKVALHVPVPLALLDL